MTDRSYHHGNLRAALIEAGLAALEHSDEGPLSLRAIARDVGVSANAAYRHFADKQALLSALAAEGFRRFTQAQAEALAGASNTGDARLTAGRAYIGFARQHPALFRLMFSHFLYASQDPDLQKTAKASFEGLLAWSAQETGTDPHSPEALRQAVARWSMVHGLSHLILDGQLAFLGEQTDALIEQVLGLYASAVPVTSSASSPQR